MDSDSDGDDEELVVGRGFDEFAYLSTEVLFPISKCSSLAKRMGTSGRAVLMKTGPSL